MDDSANPYQAPGPASYPPDRARPVVAIPESWNDVPWWRRGYVCFAMLFAMLLLSIGSYLMPEFAPVSTALAGAAVAYCIYLTNAVVFHAPVAEDDRLRTWDPLEKSAAFTLSVVFFCLNAFFAWSYVNDRYLAPLPSRADGPTMERAAEAI